MWEAFCTGHETVLAGGAVSVALSQSLFYKQSFLQTGENSTIKDFLNDSPAFSLPSDQLN